MVVNVTFAKEHPYGSPAQVLSRGNGDPDRGTKVNKNFNTVNVRQESAPRKKYPMFFLVRYGGVKPPHKANYGFLSRWPEPNATISDG
jgi:hypothetical protein